jgi:hypothetical protein
MKRPSKVQYFDTEGHENLPKVIKEIKNYLRSLQADGNTRFPRLVFLTSKGQGPLLAFNELASFNVEIIAVTFPRDFHVRTGEDEFYYPEIPEKLRKFFVGVEIPIVTGRLPFDPIDGADFHNREMQLLQDALSIFGGSMPLAIQAVLQATDSGFVQIGEQVIAVTSDTAALITASSTKHLLSKTCGLVVNEIICKPRFYTITRRSQYPAPNRELLSKSPEILDPESE